MEIEIAKITPTMAREMLKANTANRAIRRGHVEGLARDIEQGNYKLNAESIKFDKDGVLLDGQHRLSAIVKANKAVDSVVVRGLDPDVKVTIDTGKKRNFGDVLRLEGAKEAAKLAAATRYAQQSQFPSMGSTVNPTQSELAEFLEAYPYLTEAVRLVNGVPYTVLTIVAAVATMAHYTGADPAMIDKFLRHWKTGFGEEGNPCVTFRNRILEAKAMGRSFSTSQKLRMVAWSWLKLSKGELAKNARFPSEVIVPGWTIGK